jgi:hypothetical protein
MKNRRSKLGLSIIAGGLSFVGSASAIDIVIDGSYESSTNSLSGVIGVGGNDAAGIDGGWTHFSSYAYSANYTQPGPTGSGQVYLRPYDSGGGSSFVTQTNSLTRAITTAQIDGSQGQFILSAWFSTYLGQNDYSDLTLQFLDASFAPTGSPVAIGGAAFVAALPGGTGLRAWGKDTKTGLVPPGARYASISTQSHALSGQPDGYVDLVALDVAAGFVPIQVSSSPATNAVNVPPDAVVNATFQDGSLPLNTNSVQLTFDGSPVTPVIQKSGPATSVTYDPPGLLASLSTHSYKLNFNSNGGATPNNTNQVSFTVGPYVNYILPAPLFSENFDTTAEGSLPVGWSQTNYTDITDTNFNLGDLNSASYATWVVVDHNRFTSNFNSYLTHTPTLDYLRVLSTNHFNVVNGQVVTNLAQGNIVFGDSGYRDGLSQVLYLFSPDYNLSGQGNVYLSYHSLWEQNQDSVASVEYSIDQGATWLPIVYMLDGPDVVLDANGNIDAVATFSTVRGDQATYVDPADGLTKGGNYGAFIGVNSNQWSTLAPYISPRINDDPVESKRVELFRLSGADNQSHVRFRFAHAGTDSWYFGIDEFGLYSIPSVSGPVATAPSPANQTVAVGNNAALSVSAVGSGPLSYQWRHYGTNLPGRTSQVLAFASVQPSDAGQYDVVVANSGGSITSAAPAAVISVINPAVFVKGQWDFNSSNLVATLGTDLQYFNSAVSNDTSFGTTTSFGLPDINGQPTTVMHFNPSAAPWGGYQMFHGATPNGGGSFVNQYTLIYDIYLPVIGWRSLLQTDLSNVSDGDFFINPSGGVGISGIYDGNVTANVWHRVAIAIDLTGPVLTKFIDGIKVGNQTGGLSSIDGRFSLDPSALLFADEDGDTGDTYVSSVQFSNGRRPDGFIAALGGPGVSKIPGAITASVQSGGVIIRWTGGVPLQGADVITGPWSTVTGATSPYTVPPVGGKKYYRPQIP